MYFVRREARQQIDPEVYVDILLVCFLLDRFAVDLPRCESGVGEGCTDLAEGNAYILQLQKKTAEKRVSGLPERKSRKGVMRGRETQSALEIRRKDYFFGSGNHFP